MVCDRMVIIERIFPSKKLIFRKTGESFMISSSYDNSGFDIELTYDDLLNLECFFKFGEVKK